MTSTVSYLLGFDPVWTVLNNVALPNIGGLLWTYDSENPSQMKVTYSDPAGNNPNTNPIMAQGNGTFLPIYFSYDSSNPNDGYYLVMEDGNVNPSTGHGNLIWSINNYNGEGAGGGGVITNDLDISNLITNNIFWDTSYPINTNITSATSLRLAPGAHDSFVEGANVGGPTGPDIIFAKNNTNATDLLKFVPFALGSSLFNLDVTPTYYLNYTCTGLGASESYKYVQFPITPKVQNLQSIDVTVQIYAQCTSGNNSLTLYIRQFFGDGGSPTPDVLTPFATFSLTSSWAPYQATVTIPTVGGVTLGTCFNDAVFLQVSYPLSETTNINFTKPELYIGTGVPSVQFQTMDQIDAVTMTPRVGDIKTSLSNVTPFGYLPMNNGTIGNISSNASNRAANDTFPLFNALWNVGSVNQLYAQMKNSSGAPISYGASAIADYSANNQISLTKSLGQVLGGTSNVIYPTQNYSVNLGISNTNLILATTASPMPSGTPVQVSVSGGGSPPAPLLTNFIYYTIYVDATHVGLALTLADVTSNTPIVMTNIGSGTQSIQIFANPAGVFYGETSHAMSSAEIAPHTHLGELFSGTGLTANFAAGGTNDTHTTATTSANEGGTPFNVIQPTTFMNVFIKY